MDQVFPVVPAAAVPAALAELANPYQAGGLKRKFDDQY
jgi:hypothetical protein